ncbi:MAG TPA: C25 family cysteine peptidase, partial [Anaerolineales bacterium]
LELVVWGVTVWPQSPDHHLLVSVNGVPVANETFDGLGEHTLKITLPAAALHEGANTLQLTLPGDTGAPYDLVYLDKFSLTYQRLFQAQNGRLTFKAAGEKFNITNLPSANVVVYRISDAGLARLENVQVQATSSTFSATFAGTDQVSTYLVTTVEAMVTPALEAARLQADLNRPAQYLIISHPDFINGLQPLVQARQAQGLTVSVVNVNDLYAQYTSGVFDPQAIKQYIAYAARNLGTQYVLLVGGDTSDYRNYLGRNSISFIPSLYVTTGPNAKFVPADPLYADLNGDNEPDLAIGRFPVRTTAELNLMVIKTLSYAGKSYGRTAVYATDLNDGIVSFKALSNGLAASMPAGWTVQNIHLDDMSVASARTQLLAAMNRGTALVTFTGHSGPASWTFSNLFNVNDAAALTNAGKPFVVVQWGCWNTYYVDPVNNYLVQKFLFSGDRGAAAVLGASTLTDSASEDLLGELLIPRMVKPGMTIGQALQDAKSELAQTHPELLDVLLGWSLMGDPALMVEP